MKAREYKSNHYYWLSLHQQKGPKGERTIQIAMFHDSYEKDEVIESRWIFMGNGQGVILKEDQFDSDGEAVYTGTKWNNEQKEKEESKET